MKPKDEQFEPKEKKPLVSPALMRALTEGKGMDTEGAINYVQSWHKRFGKDK